jgi:predicted NBD/HSP70 family sugar kinase
MRAIPSRPITRALVRTAISVPPVTARLSTPAIASCVARHLANGVNSRAELARVTGLARTTIATGVNFLVAKNVIESSGVSETDGRGRPSDRLEFTPRSGLIAVADLGVETSSLSLFLADQTCVSSRFLAVDLAAGPDLALPTLLEQLREMADEFAPIYGTVQACVVAIPGAVDGLRSGIERPLLLPGWRDIDIVERFASVFACPVTADRDVNLRAIGEAQAITTGATPLLLVKIAATVECGFVTEDGAVLRGADGVAGDIGHIYAPQASHRECPCGLVGCLATLISTNALVERYGEAVQRTVSLAEFEQNLRAGEAEAVQLLREGTRALGHVLAGLVNFANPARIVISGAITEWNPDILSGIRGAIYERARSITTQRLTVTEAAHGHWSATAGAVLVGIDMLLSEQRLGAL